MESGGKQDDIHKISYKITNEITDYLHEYTKNTKIWVQIKEFNKQVGFR